MNPYFVPSLRHIASAKVAVAICNHPEFRDLIEKIEFRFVCFAEMLWTEEQWGRLRKLAREKVSTLELPLALQQRVVGIIRPISFEIKQWFEGLKEIPRSHLNFCWRSDGTIDGLKTAQALVRNHDVWITKRFLLACQYCLVGDVSWLWSKMSKNHRRLVSDDSLIVRLWIDSLMEKSSASARWFSNHIDEVLFTVADNTAALRFLLRNLTPEKRGRVLAVTALSFSFLDRPACLLYCVSQMDADLRVEIFGKMPFKILKCFLEWPLQDAFFDAAEHMFEYLSPSDFSNLVRFIRTEKIRHKWEDFDYGVLLGELLERCPQHLKEGLNCSLR